jgi:hypothetical protein
MFILLFISAMADKSITETGAIKSGSIFTTFDI